MMSFRNAFLAILLWGALLLPGHAQAQEPIRFGRLPDISPDGKLVAFSYLGDIWTVETIGGIARPVTMHSAHDTAPVFSPDGKWLAFSSNRHGSYDVFVVPVYGGKPRRLTFDSAPDMVCGWSPDGKQILFTSRRGTEFPSNEDLYMVPVEGGRERRITFAQGKEGVFSPVGDKIAYVRGQVDWYRKGYRGSSNDDIWICNADGTNNVQMTTFNGQDASPMWSPDGHFLYYVSDFHATPDKPHSNIVRQEVGAAAKIPSLLTFHKDESVRRARISRNGEWIVYECGPDLFVVNTHEGSIPRKLAIEVHADDKANTEVTKSFTEGATEFSLSADEKHIAFVVHGDIFMMPLGGGGKVTRLTDSGAYDHGIAWAPDSSKIIFTSDREGHEELYLLEADDPEHPKFVEAKKFKEPKRLTNDPDAEVGVQFSPDGKLVTFLRAGKLYSMKPDGTDLKTIVNDVQVVDYEWAPDSKWICYARMDGSFASELYIIPAGGYAAGDTGRNVTRHATFNAGVTWSARGNKIAFLSERRQGMGMYVLSLQKPAADGAPSNSDIDWDDIHLRVSAPTPLPAEEGSISSDGSRVAFRANGDLWVASTEGGSVSRITSNTSRPSQITWSRRNSDVLYFRDGTGKLRILRLGGLDALASLLGSRSGSGTAPSGPQPVEIPFRIKMTIRQDEEFSEMLEQSWRALQESFYDAKFHGIDWHTVRAKYRPLVKHVAMKEDLYALVSLMMGELNASHLGIYGFGTTPEEFTGDLGLIFDESYHGPGLKIAEILKRGPADRRGMNLKAGDMIRSIDGTEITEQTNLSQILNSKVGESVVLQVTSSPTADPKDPKAWRRVEVHPSSRGTIQTLMYDRWVERNTKRVAELSKGKLGYIHIPGMDEAGLDHFVRALYSDNFDKEAIVLDVRYNGGGFTHDQVLNYLGGKEHAIFRNREGGEGLVLRSSDRKWTKPLTLLINQRSYSDAEIFPNAFRTLGLGKLVGVPTGGYVIGTGSTRLIDGSVFRVPRIGVYTTRGVNMEKEGVPPDVLVEVSPDQMARGLDPQLDKAVEVLQADVAVWKKAHQGGLAQKPPDDKPVTAPTPAPVPVVPMGMK